MAVAPLTTEQRDALDTPGAEVAVAAGAGSGKTRLLVEAIWEDVERHGIGVGELFVATYNRAAAEHLTARLAERFADPDDGRGPARAGLDLSAAWVGTFHSLCGRIAREHPFAAGVDPGFAELDEAEAAALTEEALDEALEDTEDAGFDELLAGVAQIDEVRAAALVAHERLRAAGHEAPRLRVPAAGGPDALDAIDAALRSAAAALEAHPRASEQHRRAVALALEMADDRVPTASPQRAHKRPAEVVPLVGAFNAALENLARALADREARVQLRGFARFLERFGAGYARRKAEVGALDYEDLQLAARRALRGGVHLPFRRGYVDEFQDVNPLQDEILGLLRIERVIVVGDGCQAIYGFRHADAALFARRRRAAAERGATLRGNHRSQAPLLGALNDWLGRALADDPAFGPLVPAAPAEAEPPLATPPAELVTVEASDGVKAGRVHEAHAVADVVADLHDRGYAWRDIAVLFRALTEVEPYRAALAARGIPTHVVSGRGFFSHDQVQDALALLRLVENPWDEESLVRVLASPYVAASDDNLVALRRAAGERAPLWPAVAGVPALAPLAVLVAELRDRARDAGLPGLVEAVMSADDYDLAALGMADGRRRFANLRRLVGMAESFAAVRGPDLRGFLAAVDRRERLAQDPGEAVLVDPDLPAVRLATVHAVKGQEFPAVVLADASHGRRSGTPLILVDPEGAAGLRLPLPGGRVSALAYPALHQAAQAADDAEERRIVYVALTRARRHLTVVGRTPTKGTVMDILETGLAPGVGRRTVVVADVEPPDPGALPDLPVPPDAEPPPTPPARAVDPVAGRRLSFTALQRHATCALRFHLETELGLRGPREDPIPVPGAGAGGPWGALALGDVVHRALEAHDWRGPPPASGWASEAARRAGLPPSPEEAARAERLVAAAVGPPLGPRVAAGQPVAERRFALTAAGAVLVGAVDVMVTEPDGGALLVDWKTHALGEAGPAELMRDYRLQQALYGLAALRAGVERADLAWVFLEAPSEPQVRAVTTADAAGLEAEVAEALAGLRDDPRAPAATTAQPFCAGCPGLRVFCPVSRSG